MKIELNEIPVREVAEGYIDSAENGCTGYGGRLNIRPAFQREFIYNDTQREEVINSIVNNFPLNVMYWSKSDDGNFEMPDGQQRTISICQYVTDGFSFNHRTFTNLTKTEQNQILDYKLMIYICDGDDKERLSWFKIINIAGVELTNQELRNAIYTGTWLSDAKIYFSKPQCTAYRLAKDYLNGAAIRQDYLETALKWIIDGDNLNAIEDYMSIHQHDDNASRLYVYFRRVIDRVKLIFPKYRREMKGIDWGILYNEFGNVDFDPVKLEEKISALMMDDDVTNKRGIYSYVLDNKERHLNIRKFSPAMKRSAYERQKGICANCNKKFSLEEMQADHILAWSNGGKTVAENCQLLCADCNRQKSNS